MMAAGYYVPVMMHNGVVYYNQHVGPPTEHHHPAYYPTTYAPYVSPDPSPRGHVGGTSSKALNIDAPAFNPKEKCGE